MDDWLLVKDQMEKKLEQRKLWLEKGIKEATNYWSFVDNMSGLSLTLYSTTKFSHIKDKDENKLVDEEKIADRWKEYVESLYKDNDLE